MENNTYLFIVLFALLQYLPLFIALMVTLAGRMRLGSFVGLMFILEGIKVATSYLLFNVDVWPMVASFAIGVVLSTILLGIFGKKISTRDYLFFFAILGLFPWHLGLNHALPFVGALVVCILIYAMFKFSKAKKKYRVFGKTPSQVKLEMGDEKWRAMMSDMGGSFAVPGIFATIIAMSVAFLTMASS